MDWNCECIGESTPEIQRSSLTLLFRFSEHLRNSINGKVTLPEFQVDKELIAVSDLLAILLVAKNG